MEYKIREYLERLRAELKALQETEYKMDLYFQYGRATKINTLISVIKELELILNIRHEPKTIENVIDDFIEGFKK